MAGLLERFSRWLTPAKYEKRNDVDNWLSNYLIPSTFSYNGTTYPVGLRGTLAGNRAMEVVNTLPSHARVIQQSPPAWGAQMVRAATLSQVRFTFRNPPWHPRTPRRQFSNSALRLLEQPWPNGSTGELVARMEWHEGLGGMAIVARRPDRLQVLRPDWCGILWGSQTEELNPAHALDRELLGYVYQNGGLGYSEFGYKPHFLLPDECIHWAPNGDPLDSSVGMSWITPAIRELQSDILAGQHKIKYWENGATPNLVVKGIPAVNREQFDEVVEMMEERHAGAANAFRTLYLTAGADADVIGNNFHEIDFRGITAAGETRISVLSRVPASILGITEGLQGSSLNAGNFAAARRTFADTWVYPTLQDLAKSLAPLIEVPADAELWYDTQDMPLLREDAKDQAEIDLIKTQALRTLVDGGFEPEGAIKTVAPEWIDSLKHTGNVSVQLQPPGVAIKNASGAQKLLDGPAQS